MLLNLQFSLIFLLILIAKSCFAFDFIRDSLKLINQSSDPCDNFFRHACPLDSSRKGLARSVYDNFENQFFKNHKPRSWHNLNFKKALDDVKLAEVPTMPVKFISQYFQTRCENHTDTVVVLQKIEQMVHNSKTPKCNQDSCLTILAADSNCTRATQSLMKRLEENLKTPSNTTKGFVDYLKDFHHTTMLNIDGISLLLGEDIRYGISVLNQILEDQIEIAKDWIEETPWLENYSLTNFTNQLVSDMKLIDNFGSVLEENLDNLMHLEQTYLNCLRELKIVGENGGELLCLFYTVNVLNLKSAEMVFFNQPNAYNQYPYTAFSYPFLHVVNNSVMAAKLGFTGFIAGHEISHTLIENPNSTFLFPLFSDEAIQCVQDQYNATCNEFREGNCNVTDAQIDENGSDVLGGQLAYRLFEIYYGDKLKDEYLKLNNITITNQQLFFYSAAFTHCNGQATGVTDRRHQASNVRANVLAQLPGFQDAFKCAPESRMMRTVKKQCIIFGKNAPAQK